MNPPPPPPPPHGEGVPRHSGLPPGKYDIFIIPPHSSGSGFLYLPSLKPNVNSFAAGFASALVLVVVGSALTPVVQAWWAGVKSSGGTGMILIMLAIGVGAWALGRAQTDGGSGPGAAKGDGNAGGPAHGSSEGSTHGPNHGGPPPNANTSGTGPGSGPGTGPNTGTNSRMPGGAGEKPKPTWGRTNAGAGTDSGGGYWAGAGAGAGRSTSNDPRGGWEKAREETKRKEEERKAREAERKAKEEAERKVREAREREARERETRERAERERKEREAEKEKERERERREQEERERERREREEKERERRRKERELEKEKERERERKEREREEREMERERKEKEREEWERERREKERERERREKEMEREREMEKERERQREKEREREREREMQRLREREALRKQLEEEALEKLREKEALKKEIEKELLEKQQKEEALKKQQEKEALKKQQDMEALKKQQEKEADNVAQKSALKEEPRVKSTYAFSSVGEKTNPWPNGHPTVSIRPPPSPPKRPPAPTPKTPIGKEEEKHSFRPYDKLKNPDRKKSQSSVYSESSCAASYTTGATTPPPSHREPYSTKDPDKIVIKAVYSFTNAFLRTPTSQLVSGIGSVTDGLILRITTEGLFIDDDVRGVPQREWDIKAWTMKLVEVWCPNFRSGPSTASASRPSGPQNPVRRLWNYEKEKAAMSEEVDALLVDMLQICKDSCHFASRASSTKNTSRLRSPASDVKKAHLHVLRASIRDQEGRRYVFVVSEEESWKMAVGLQRLRRGTQVRALGVCTMSAADSKSTLENLGWA